MPPLLKIAVAPLLYFLRNPYIPSKGVKGVLKARLNSDTLPLESVISRPIFTSLSFLLAP
jgi:hypothetical protein